MHTNETILYNILPFWDKLSEDERETILDSSIHRRFKMGAVVHRRDMGGQGAILLNKGAIRAYLISEEEKEVTLFRIREGECCALTASCLLDSIQFDIFIEISEASEAVIIPTPALDHIMRNNRHVGFYMYRQITEGFSDVMWILQQILFMGADRRLAAFLWEETVSRGEDTLMTTHDEIARSVGSVREVVTKTLRYFADEGALALGRGKIYIMDREKLRKHLQNSL